MDLSKKVWLLNCCEGTLDGLVRCYLHGSTQGYRLLRSAVGDVKAHPALEKPGIYFVDEIIDWREARKPSAGGDCDWRGA